MKKESKPRKQQQQQLNPYQIDKLGRIPLEVKIYAAKFLIAGSVYFYFAFGFGGGADLVDTIVLTGLVLGACTDFFTNGLIRWCDHPENPSLHYRSINFARFVALPLNLLYGVVIMIPISFTFEWLRMNGEPFFFALFYCTYDYIWLRLRWWLEGLWDRRKLGRANEK